VPRERPYKNFAKAPPRGHGVDLLGDLRVFNQWRRMMRFYSRAKNFATDKTAKQVHRVTKRVTPSITISPKHKISSTILFNFS
jgi:hypothetical protein